MLLRSIETRATYIGETVPWFGCDSKVLYVVHGNVYNIRIDEYSDGNDYVCIIFGGKRYGRAYFGTCYQEHWTMMLEE